MSTISVRLRFLFPIFIIILTMVSAPVEAAITCARTITADVVALHQPFFYNRYGAFNPSGFIYALKRDVVDLNNVPLTQGGAAIPGQVRLRPDKRPRPIVLRMNVSDCLTITFTNLLPPVGVPIDDGPTSRHASVHVGGMQLVNSISDDGSNVGKNASSLAAPGETKVYTFLANFENVYLLTSMGVPFGGEGAGVTQALGLFGAVNVEPENSEWYRSQLTREEMDLATVGTTPAGQPIINYDARYPNAAPFIAEGKAGLPIVNMLNGNQIVHTDINAIITGPGRGNLNGGPQPGIKYGNPAIALPANDHTVTTDGQQVLDRTRPFREFSVIFHDEIFAIQAFPGFFEDPVLKHTLHCCRDGFAINYGTGGIASEILANRLGVGPVWDCVDCKYEEFFLTSWAVGDPAMNVDIPANAGLEALTPNAAPNPAALGPKATTTLFPDDPSNVHHAYMNDEVKFRNIHAGPKEHHIFHLHAHQWVFSPLNDEATYLDIQAIGPGTGYTYEMVFGGSGNRNKTPGDAIFHCHFYPHFAQGMWELYRVHDVFEEGTVLAEQAPGRAPFALRTATPVAGARALPDGEIVAGTPIPALVPIPGMSMAPMPGGVTVAQLPGRPGSQVVITEPDNNGDGIPDRNLGYPFYIAAVAGHRPSTPPLDILVDGGIPRHAPAGPLGANADPLARQQVQTRLDFSKVVLKMEAEFPPETGTPAEIAAMRAHEQRLHNTFVSPLTSTAPLQAGKFILNGQPRVRGAPYAEPCVDDAGNRIEVGANPFYLGETALTPQGIQFGAANPRTYKHAHFQLDVVFNKVGWHFPQQRIIALNEDVLPTLAGTRPPEPMIWRFNTNDCVELQSTNLIPSVYELDDFQVRTPTDVIGQHMHHIKFDVTSSDGSANGWNYEDGNLSPDEVRERIHAINATMGTSFVAQPHPVFGAGPNGTWVGARTSVQRLFTDPLLDKRGVDRGLGIIFTHDHFGPSTHQQVGLYSTFLVEPAGSQWFKNETDVALFTRGDGGPTTWQARIIPGPEAAEKPFREFYFEFQDFQLAYERDFNGDVSPTSFLKAINPPTRVAVNEINPFPDLVLFPAICKGGVPRPCPEGVSADDVGTFVMNYRNEPVGLRIFDPNRVVGTGQNRLTGFQAAGKAGDLAFAFSSNEDIVRAIPALNNLMPSCVRNTVVAPAPFTEDQGDGIHIGPELPCPQLTFDVGPTDPATPMMRAYAGDDVRVKMQVGATEEGHVANIHGLKWLQEFENARSGWRNAQMMGISEQFIFKTPIIAAPNQAGNRADYLYTGGAANDGFWNGEWGLLRSYRAQRNDLVPLPTNLNPNPQVVNANDFRSPDRVCPNTAPLREFEITAVRAADVLPGGRLIYNSRAAAFDGRTGPLNDPTALLYVRTQDLVLNNQGKPIGLKAGTPIEPLILRVNAGDCISVNLRNALPDPVPDLNGFNIYVPIVDLDENAAGKTTFNANRVVPSSQAGMHTQLVAYDITRADGNNVGINSGIQTVASGGLVKYTWYAGDLRFTRLDSGRVEFVATPVEFGAVNLMPADRLEQTQKGLYGSLVVLPQGAAWVEDPGTRASATVTKADGSTYRDFVAVAATNINLYDAAGSPIPPISAETGGVPEDAEDAGSKAFNYKIEPAFFRFGFAPDLDFNAQLGIANAQDYYSNALIGGADPETPIFTAKAGEQVRFHFVQPAGNARNASIALHGHVWEREPYNQNASIDGPTKILDNKEFIPECPAGIPGNCTSQWVGTQEGFGVTNHVTLVPKHGAGGGRAVAGDYLYRFMDSFHNLSGMWGIFRVTP